MNWLAPQLAGISAGTSWRCSSRAPPIAGPPSDEPIRCTSRVAPLLSLPRESIYVLQRKRYKVLLISFGPEWKVLFARIFFGFKIKTMFCSITNFPKGFNGSRSVYYFSHVNIMHLLGIWNPRSSFCHFFVRLSRMCWINIHCDSETKANPLFKKTSNTNLNLITCERQRIPRESWAEDFNYSRQFSGRDFRIQSQSEVCRSRQFRVSEMGITSTVKIVFQHSFFLCNLKSINSSTLIRLTYL